MLRDDRTPSRALYIGRNSYCYEYCNIRLWNKWQQLRKLRVSPLPLAPWARVVQSLRDICTQSVSQVREESRYRARGPVRDLPVET